jgi:TldD protein
LRHAWLSLLLPLAALAPAAEAPSRAVSAVILRAMQDEMQRSRALRAMAVDQPYYFEYGLHDGENVTAAATLGALIRSTRVRFRLPAIEIRVGSPQFDNTNFAGPSRSFGGAYGVEAFPLDDSYPVLRHHLWLATDAEYKSAVETLALKRAALRNITLRDNLPDFSDAKPLQMITTVPPSKLDETAWAARVRRLSALFLGFPGVLGSSVSFEGGSGLLYLVTSEGTRVRVPEGSVALRIQASAQASDGMPVRDTVVFHALDPDRLPPDAEIERSIKEVAGNVTALAEAPTGETYAGPVLFEGTAAGQLFAEVLGHNLAASRASVPFSGPAGEFEDRIGTRVLPEWMDVVDDPTVAEWQGHPLFGHYPVDLEGVAPVRVPLVQKGILVKFLLTRQPIKGFSESNGHARLPGRRGVKGAAIGNLFVQASGGVPQAELRKRLIDLCRQRNKPYGIVIRGMDYPTSAPLEELSRLFRNMMRSKGGSRLQSRPVLVYRLYQDGHEQLVRGLQFRGLDTRSLKDILAASSDSTVFDFYDNGAPLAAMYGTTFVSEASVIAPSVLVDDLELEPVQDELPKPPLVPPPPLAALWPRTGTFAQDGSVLPPR